MQKVYKYHVSYDIFKDGGPGKRNWSGSGRIEINSRLPLSCAADLEEVEQIIDEGLKGETEKFIGRISSIFLLSKPVLLVRFLRSIGF